MMQKRKSVKQSVSQEKKAACNPKINYFNFSAIEFARGGGGRG